eukprot:COSAG04_NODE_6916_length_1228_cov_13839.736283_2_plen_267_part_00
MLRAPLAAAGGRVRRVRLSLALAVALVLACPWCRCCSCSPCSCPCFCLCSFGSSTSDSLTRPRRRLRRAVPRRERRGGGDPGDARAVGGAVQRQHRAGQDVDRLNADAAPQTKCQRPRSRPRRGHQLPVAERRCGATPHAWPGPCVPQRPPQRDSRPCHWHHLHVKLRCRCVEFSIFPVKRQKAPHVSECFEPRARHTAPPDGAALTSRRAGGPKTLRAPISVLSERLLQGLARGAEDRAFENTTQRTTTYNTSPSPTLQPLRSCG